MDPGLTNQPQPTPNRPRGSVGTTNPANPVAMYIAMGELDKSPPIICGNGNVVIGSGRRSSQKSRLTGTATPGSSRGRPSICKAESEPASRNLAGPTDGRGGR
jgi:hypothetical protein